MECDYTHLNHNLLVSQKKKKKVDHLRHDYKGGFTVVLLLFCTMSVPTSSVTIRIG
jgi:hypothetical protein